MQGAEEEEENDSADGLDDADEDSEVDDARQHNNARTNSVRAIIAVSVTDVEDEVTMWCRGGRRLEKR